MANNLDAMYPEYWSKRTQNKLRDTNISRVITSSEEKANLSNGDKVNRPYTSDATIGSIGLNTGTYSPTDVTSTQEYLTIDTWNFASQKYTKSQMKQLKYKPVEVNDQIDRNAYQLGLHMDRTVLGQYTNAGVNTTTVNYTKTTIYDGVAECARTLRGRGNASNKEKYLVVDDYITTLIQTSNAARETMLGDKVTKGGFGFNRVYGGLSIYESPSALTWTGEFVFAANAAEGETIVIDGVIFTFNATPSGAGSVDIGASAAATIDNLVTLINDPLTTTATGIALSAADAAKFQDLGQTLISAADGTTTLDLTSIKGRVPLSYTLADTGSGMQNMVLHCLAGEMGNIDLVTQIDIETEFKKGISGFQGTEIVTDVLWGLKTFQEGANRMTDFRVTTQDDSLAS